MKLFSPAECRTRAERGVFVFGWAGAIAASFVFTWLADEFGWQTPVAIGAALSAIRVGIWVWEGERRDA